MQIHAAFSQLTDIGYITSNRIWIVALITVVATTSTGSDVSRRIKYFSIANVAIMCLVLGFVFLTGPTLYQIQTLARDLNDYVLNWAPMSL